MCWWGRDGTSWYAQLRLLLWKNWVLKKRRWGASCCELLFPVVVFFILMLVRALVKVTEIEDIIPIQDKQMVRTPTHDSPLCGTESMQHRVPTTRA